jgi:hypothetical protein
MPLQASHLKFALDLKDYFKPNDLSLYLAGAIYPDSRYVSGIDRKATHNYDYWLEKFWQGDDFKKGWASHTVSDKAYTKGIRKIFPAWNDFSEGWVMIENTAVKIIGDMVSLQGLDIKGILGCIKAMPSANNESKEKMEDHLQVIKRCYKNGDNAVIEDYSEILEKYLGSEVGKKIIAQAKIFAGDKKISAEIEKFFFQDIGFGAIDILKETNRKI